MAEKTVRGVRTTDRASAPAAIDAVDIEKQVRALDVEVQQAMRSGHHDFNREFKDFMGVLTSLASEIKLDHPSAQTLESLGMAARHRWNKIAKMAVGHSPDGKPRADQFELNLIAQSKLTMDSILLSATLADPRNKEVQDDAIDKPTHSSDDQSMTDMTRQQVTDLLAASEAKTGERLANFQLDIKSGFADLRTEFSEVRSEFANVRAEMANNRAESSKQNQDNLKWIIGAIFAMISIAVAIIGAMINFSKSDKPAAAPPAPIIITVPAIAAQPVATPQAAQK